MFAHRFRTLVGAAALTAGALVTSVAAQDSEVVEREKVTVTVENANFHDVRVYAVSGTRSWRLGNVFGLSEQTFDVPRFVTATNEPLRIVAYPIGTASVVSSSEVLVQPGDQVVYRVEPRLPLSNVRVLPQS